MLTELLNCNYMLPFIKKKRKNDSEGGATTPESGAKTTEYSHALKAKGLLWLVYSSRPIVITIIFKSVRGKREKGIKEKNMTMKEWSERCCVADFSLENSRGPLVNKSYMYRNWKRLFLEPSGKNVALAGTLILSL